MFKKRTCKKCGKKISGNYRFCPHCGATDGDFDKGDWGILGRDDLMPKNFFPANNDFNMIFNSLVRNLGKQINNSFNEPKKFDKNFKKNGISISISTSGNNPSKIKVKSLGEPKQMKKLPEQFSKEHIKKFSKLPKKEPKTNIRRLSNKVIYEVELPEVDSIKDISIIRLESSIEIKAIGKNCAYSKRIPLNLPIVDYSLADEKLILEFGIKE